MHDIKFLESIENIKSFIKNKLNWTPNTKKAQEISSCLIQGRLFFQAAETSPIEIKPLQLYYGIMAFASAIILVRTGMTLDSFPQSHGLSAKLDNKLAASAAEINKSGVFFDFNNVVCELDGIHYYIGDKIFNKKLPASTSDKLSGRIINIKDILGRLPDMDALYFNTFNETPKNTNIFFFIHDDKDKVRIEINDGFAKINTRESLVKLVEDLRNKYPFLLKWCLTEGFSCWDKTRLYFENLEKNDIDDLSESFLVQKSSEHFKAQNISSMERFELTDYLQPLIGTLLKNHQYASEPFEGCYISEFALYYLGTFILSSIARYRPNVWMRAITHSILSNESVDDSLLAILEKFMDMAIKNVPIMVKNAFEITY